MATFKLHLKITILISIVTVFVVFSTLNAKNFDKYYKAGNVADYFSGILLLNKSQYDDSYKYLKKLDGLEKSHSNFSSIYLYTLINSKKFNQAFAYSKKLEKDNQESFESNIITGIYYSKNNKNELAKKYFLKAKEKSPKTILDNYLINSLYSWSNLKGKNIEGSISDLQKLDERFSSLKKIQNVFLYSFFGHSDAEKFFNELTSDQKTDFSRYNYFYAKYLHNLGKVQEAKKILNSSLKKYPRNLLLNQYKLDLENSENNFSFDFKKETHIIAEILYIVANAFSSQSIYSVSNFYLNLSKYLNKDFHAFDTLMAENFYNIDDFVNSKKIYKNLEEYGSAFKWFSNKQISRILVKEEKEKEAIKLLKEAYNKLPFKGVYETFDYAEFLKNNEEFENSIKYYTNILNQIEKDHPLYTEVTDGRGVSYERIGQWDKAEKDLISSLEVNPDQAYVINYLAYSWIEQGVKIKKSLSMLERANKLKSNDPYIIDSLGWALFKLKRYKESKNYLQLALRLMPADPIVNDHYGDVLWKNGNEIQARYYWKYVLNLEKAEKDLKEKVQKKLIKGL